MDALMRPSAPGVLGTLQDFLNSGHLEASSWLAPDVAAQIQRRVGAGESRITVGSEYGFSQALVSAVARGAALYDELGSEAEASAWLQGRELLLVGSDLSPRELERLIELRELLRLLAAGNAHGGADQAATEALTRLASAAPLVVSFAGTDATVSLEPVSAGGQGAIGRLLAMLFDSMRDGSWQRLKRCPGNGCPFTFYDASRNRTGTWCSMAVCGNRAKVRGYQARRRAQAAK